MIDPKYQTAVTAADGQLAAFKDRYGGKIRELLERWSR